MLKSLSVQLLIGIVIGIITGLIVPESIMASLGLLTGILGFDANGTALMLADGISKTLAEEPQYVYDRHAYRKKRSKNEIGIHSVRGGTIVGEHEVIFAGHDEVVTLTHQAQSKEVFAAGAVNAAVFLASQQPGMYDMSKLLSSKI
jgi:4-hydroxy-tetrahydrodipicolinate reductase